MAGSEIETVLANWIRQALDPPGQFPQGTDASVWIAARFAEWWRERAEDALCDAESAASAIRVELTRMGGWESQGEAMHEHCHLQDALRDLRQIMGLAES
jgi:hypothetical protein